MIGPGGGGNGLAAAGRGKGSMGLIQMAHVVVIPDGGKWRDWAVDTALPSCARIRDEYENVIADCRTIDGPSPRVDRQQDAHGRADLIVRAVNAHDALVAALARIVHAADHATPVNAVAEIARAVELARPALAKAEGNQ